MSLKSTGGRQVDQQLSNQQVAPRLSPVDRAADPGLVRLQELLQAPVPSPEPEHVQDLGAAESRERSGGVFKCLCCRFTVLCRCGGCPQIRSVAAVACEPGRLRCLLLRGAKRNGRRAENPSAPAATECAAIVLFCFHKTVLSLL